MLVLATLRGGESILDTGKGRLHSTEVSPDETRCSLIRGVSKANSRQYRQSMNSRFLRSFTRIATLILTLSFTAGVLTAAEPKPGGRVTTGKQGKASPANSAEIDLLRNAYGMLAKADHDYKGHRHKAMVEIAEAAKLLGVTFHGDGRAGERQSLSDAQLRNVKEMLLKSHAGLDGKHHKQVRYHIDKAINEISIALSII